MSPGGGPGGGLSSSKHEALTLLRADQVDPIQSVTWRDDSYADAPAARLGHTATVVDSQMFVVGGRLLSEGPKAPPTSDVLLLDASPKVCLVVTGSGGYTLPVMEMGGTVAKKGVAGTLFVVDSANKHEVDNLSSKVPSSRYVYRLP